MGQDRMFGSWGPQAFDYSVNDKAERFTPDEISALMDAGEMTMDLMHKMHPDDVKTMVALEKKRTSGGQDFQKLTAAAAGGGLGNSLLKTGGTAIEMGINGAKHLGGALSTGAGIFGLSKAAELAGMPADARNALLMGWGFKGLAGKGAAASAPAVAVEAGAAESVAVRQQLTSKGYPPALIEKILAKDANRMAPPGVPAAPARPPLTSQGTPMDAIYEQVQRGAKPTPGTPFSEIREQVQRGVQNDFPGPMGKPISLRKPVDKFSGGVNSNYDEWVAAQEAKSPPGRSLEELLNALQQSLGRDRR